MLLPKRSVGLEHTSVPLLVLDLITLLIEVVRLVVLDLGIAQVVLVYQLVQEQPSVGLGGLQQAPLLEVFL